MWNISTVPKGLPYNPASGLHRNRRQPFLAHVANILVKKDKLRISGGFPSSCNRTCVENASSLFWLTLRTINKPLLNAPYGDGHRTSRVANAIFPWATTSGLFFKKELYFPLNLSVIFNWVTESLVAENLTYSLPSKNYQVIEPWIISSLNLADSETGSCFSSQGVVCMFQRGLYIFYVSSVGRNVWFATILDATERNSHRLVLVISLYFCQSCELSWGHHRHRHKEGFSVVSQAPLSLWGPEEVWDSGILQ